MRAWLLALTACGAPVVISNRAEVPAARSLEQPIAAPHTLLVAAPDYAGCDATGCPMTMVRVTAPVRGSDTRTHGLERDVAVRHRRLIVLHRFAY